MHEPIDFLTNSKAKTAQAWIQAHPEIELLAEIVVGIMPPAASQGATKSIHTAHRFHLCKNLTKLVKNRWRFVVQNCAKDQIPRKKPPKMLHHRSMHHPCTNNSHPYTAHQTARYDRYQQVMALRHKQRESKTSCNELVSAAPTIQPWLTDEPMWKPTIITAIEVSFDRYEAYVRPALR